MKYHVPQPYVCNCDDDISSGTCGSCRGNTLVREAYREGTEIANKDRVILLCLLWTIFGVLVHDLCIRGIM